MGNITGRCKNKESGKLHSFIHESGRNIASVEKWLRRRTKTKSTTGRDPKRGKVKTLFIDEKGKWHRLMNSKAGDGVIIFPDSDGVSWFPYAEFLRKFEVLAKFTSASKKKRSGTAKATAVAKEALEKQQKEIEEKTDKMFGEFLRRRSAVMRELAMEIKASGNFGEDLIKLHEILADADKATDSMGQVDFVVRTFRALKHTYKNGWM